MQVATTQTCTFTKKQMNHGHRAAWTSGFSIYFQCSQTTQLLFLRWLCLSMIQWQTSIL